MVEENNKSNDSNSKIKSDEEAPPSRNEGPILSRRWILNRNLSKRDFGILAIILIGLVLMVFFAIFGGKKNSENIQQEEEFEVMANRAINLPKPPSPVSKQSPSPEKIDKKALALMDARLKSAIVIYNKNSKGDGQAADPNNRPGSSDPNRRFQEQNGSLNVPKSEATTIGNLDTKILQGKMIDAIMETAVNSDLPGMVRAIVSNNIFGESGRRILLPRGTRLVGRYNSAIRKGQARVFMVWNRAIRPDGIEITLDSGGTDPLGRAGIKGKVNNHFWQIFGTSALLSIIGAGVANVGVGTSDEFNSISAYREELANSFKDSSSQLLNRYIDIPPTINIKQGSRIKVFVARDLDFSEALGRSYGSSQHLSSHDPWVIRL